MEILERSRELILEEVMKRKENGNYDTIYAVARSDSDNYYTGKPFESTTQSQFHHCAERHAINQMQLEESEDTVLESILIAMPVPDGDKTLCMPCGACRSAIIECGDENTTVISTAYVRNEDDWDIFIDHESYRAGKLLPQRYENPWE